MKVKLLLYFCFLLIKPIEARASCLAPIFTNETKIKVRSPLLLVTHASDFWDDSRSAEQGVNEAIIEAQEKKHSIIYLHASGYFGNPSRYYYRECSPYAYVASSAGEFQFNVSHNQVTSVGGFFEHCQNQSFKSLYSSWMKSSLAQEFKLTIPANASYARYTYNDYCPRLGDSVEVHQKNCHDLKSKLSSLIDSHRYPHVSTLEEVIHGLQSKNLIRKYLASYLIPLEESARTTFEIYLNDVLLLKEGRGSKTIMINISISNDIMKSIAKD